MFADGSASRQLNPAPTGCLFHLRLQEAVGRSVRCGKPQDLAPALYGDKKTKLFGLQVIGCISHTFAAL